MISQRFNGREHFIAARENGLLSNSKTEMNFRYRRSPNGLSIFKKVLQNRESPINFVDSIG